MWRVPSQCRADTIVVSIANCAPPWRSNPSAITSKLRPSCTFMASRSKSRTITLVVTRAPASRHTLAAALSSAKPRLTNTPARAQAARWWPKTSMGRPHRQKRRARGSGSRRRWNKRVRNSWESKRTSGCVGTVDSATDLTRALSPSARQRRMVLSRKSRSTLEAASCCHPSPLMASISNFVKVLRRPVPHGQGGPRRDFETLHPFKGPSSLHSSAEVECVCATVQEVHQQSRHQVALMHLVKAVRPAGPECVWGRANSAAQVHPKPREELLLLLTCGQNLVS